MKMSCSSMTLISMIHLDVSGIYDNLSGQYYYIKSSQIKRYESVFSWLKSVCTRHIFSCKMGISVFSVYNRRCGISCACTGVKGIS